VPDNGSRELTVHIRVCYLNIECSINRQPVSNQAIDSVIAVIG